MWVQPGDFRRCLGVPKDKAACHRIYWTFYLWPRLQRELERMWPKKKPPIPEPDPGPLTPDPSPWLAHELAPVLVAQLLGEPGPQPSISAEVRLETTKAVRGGLAGFVDQLDEEIERLEKQSR